VSVDGYVFIDCRDGAHVDCIVRYTRGKCSCTCHNSDEEATIPEGNNFEVKVKTETKVTGVTVTLTPKMLTWTWNNIRNNTDRTSASHLFWRGVYAEVRKAVEAEVRGE